MIGDVSHTIPLECSSHDNHVFHGVLPPEQFLEEFWRMEYESSILPSLLNFITPTPPSLSPSSELLTYIQPLLLGKTDAPSGEPCQIYELDIFFLTEQLTYIACLLEP